ncbi:MAG: hypothetical protein H0V39_03090 [Nitrosomonas sp.]|nr:hypothetical protein [Nitrosomonas sp.]
MIVALYCVAGSAQAGQPLYISSITILPNGCDNPTSTVELIAAGGQPDSSGNYSYMLNGTTQTARTSNFSNVPAGSVLTVTVTDSADASVTWQIIFPASLVDSVNMSLVLPLGAGSGCITLTVVDPPVDTVVFGLQLGGPSVTPELITVAQFPFVAKFSAPPTTGSETYGVLIAPKSDCASDFEMRFPFPQGIASPLKTFIVNKFCANCGQGAALS